MKKLRERQVKVSVAQVAAKPKVSVIVPAYNEEAVISSTLNSLTEALGSLSYEVLVVLNGCKDRTLEKVQALSKKNPSIRWVVLPKQGKGYALREGLTFARGELVAFFDADGQIPVKELVGFLSLLESSPQIDGVIGSKYKAGSRWSLRSLTGRAFNLLVRIVLGIPYKDTQCGLKVFRQMVLKEVVRDLSLEGWVFDAQLLALLHKGGKKIKEVPVEVKQSPRPSKLRIFDVLSMALDVIRIQRGCA